MCEARARAPQEPAWPALGSGLISLVTSDNNVEGYDVNYNSRLMMSVQKLMYISRAYALMLQGQ
jgi:hypothetical protein